eukprot:536277_1
MSSAVISELPKPSDNLEKLNPQAQVEEISENTNKLNPNSVTNGMPAAAVETTPKEGEEKPVVEKPVVENPVEKPVEKPVVENPVDSPMEDCENKPVENGATPAEVDAVATETKQVEVPETKPAEEAKPAAEQNPVAEEKPVTEEKPATDEKPVVEEKQAPVEKPVAEVKPVAVAVPQPPVPAAPQATNPPQAPPAVVSAAPPQVGMAPPRPMNMPNPAKPVGQVPHTYYEDPPDSDGEYSVDASDGEEHSTYEPSGDEDVDFNSEAEAPSARIYGRRRRQDEYDSEFDLEDSDADGNAADPYRYSSDKEDYAPKRRGRMPPKRGRGRMAPNRGRGRMIPGPAPKRQRMY